MSNPPDLETLRYVLGELDAPAREAFARRLEHDPALRRQVRELQESLTDFAIDAAPPEAMTAEDQRYVLDRILAANPVPPRARFIWSNAFRRWAWPLAACLLLGLNFWQWTRPGGAMGRDRDRMRAADATTEMATTSGESGVKTPSGADGTQLAANGASPGGIAGANAASEVVNIGPEELRRLREIRGEYDQLARDHARLQEEQLTVLRQLAAYALTERGVHRLAAMELVDPARYAAGQRRGLFDFAVNLLTEPGIVALGSATVPRVDMGGGITIPNTGFGQGVVDGAGTAAPVENPDGGGDGANIAEQTGDAYAWSVFDESSGRGFLNLYNLPETPAGQSLQLWVRAAADDNYIRVGEVPPDYQGGSGSLSYTLPGATQPPAEILITAEPEDALPAQPSGPPVLRGP